MRRPVNVALLGLVLTLATFTHSPASAQQGDLGVSPERIRLELGRLFRPLEGGEAVDGLAKQVASGRDEKSILEIYSRGGKAVKVIVYVPVWPNMDKAIFEDYLAHFAVVAQMGLFPTDKRRLLSETQRWLANTAAALIKTAHIERTEKQEVLTTDKVFTKIGSDRRIRMALPSRMLSLTVNAERADRDQ